MISEFRTRLLLNESVAALIGSRLFSAGEGQGQDLPRVNYHFISGVGSYSHSGPSGVLASRLQLDCIAETSVEAEAVAKAIKYAVDGYKGYWGDVRIDSVKVPLERMDRGDSGLYRYQLDLIVTHTEE